MNHTPVHARHTLNAPAAHHARRPRFSYPAPSKLQQWNLVFFLQKCNWTKYKLTKSDKNQLPQGAEVFGTSKSKLGKSIGEIN